MTRIEIKWSTRWWWINRNIWCVSFGNIRNSFRIIAFACIAKLNRWPVTRLMDSRIVQRRMQTQRQLYQLQLMQMMRTSNYFSNFLSVAIESSIFVSHRCVDFNAKTYFNILWLMERETRENITHWHAMEEFFHFHSRSLWRRSFNWNNIDRKRAPSAIVVPSIDHSMIFRCCDVPVVLGKG